MTGTHAHYMVVRSGCGARGDGTTSAPIEAATAAPAVAWPWTTCAAADASTVRCDPDTGELWTPPEHDFTTAATSVTAPFQTLSAPGLHTLNAFELEFDPGFFPTACRAVMWQITGEFVWDVAWDDGAAFSLEVDGAGGPGGVDYRVGGNVSRDTGTPAPMTAGARTWTSTVVRNGFFFPGGAPAVTITPLVRIHPAHVGDLIVGLISSATLITGTAALPV